MLKSFASTQVIEYEQATSYRRIAARFIDMIIAVFFLLPLSGMWVALLREISNIVFPVSFFLMLIIYDTLMTQLFGKTLGKMIVGIRVVDGNGEKIDWIKSLFRAVMLYITILAIAFLFFVTASIFGWIFIQTLPKYVSFPHDKVAHDFVVREVKGELKKISGESPPLEIIPEKPRITDLERLREQGIISEEEYLRKKKETGL